MVKEGQILDMEWAETLQQELPQADPLFVQFVLAWHGLIGEEKVPFMDTDYDPSYLRRIKRWVQRDYGQPWKAWWKLILQECFNSRRKMYLKRNLFRLEPVPPLAPHRQRNVPLWTVVCDLRNYFICLSERPHMPLIGQILMPDKGYSALNTEWNKRKEWFNEKEAVARLEQHLSFYIANRNRVHETLRTKIPIYSWWET